MKLFKLIFSRAIVVALAIILQVALFFTVLYMFNSYFVWFQVISVIISLVVFLYIINKKESPEFKIPWLVIIFTVPYFGVIIYIMFARPKIRRKTKVLIKEVSEKTEHYSNSSADREKTDAVLGKYAGVARYIENSSHISARVNSRVTYYKSGEEFFAALIADLEKAEKFIFMEYFIIESGKMWDTVHEILCRKAAGGVEVRLLYDDMGCLGKVGRNYYKKLRGEGINCWKFNPLLPIVSGIYNNRDHRKIAVIDGNTAFTGGINLADEYINEIEKFGHWKDTAVKIEGPAAEHFCSMFLQLFDVTTGNISDYDKYLGLPQECFDDGGAVCVMGDGPNPHYPEKVGENTFLNLINSAEKYVYITTPYLIVDYNIETALRNAALRGVDVIIITPHIPDKKIVFGMTRSNYTYLMSAGVKIYEYTPGFIHAKTMIVDGEAAFVGTVNFDYRSLVHHYECGAVMFRTPCISDIKSDFDDTVSLSERVTPENFRMSKFAAFINSILSIFSPMF